MNVYNPVIPYCGPIQLALVPSAIIRIEGSVHSSSLCFAINLQCGPSVNPRDDIALHLSPVFSPPPRVVRNSLQSQRWGPEESYGGFPFYAGQRFEIMILIESDHFKIAINGQHFTEFRYRIPLNRINYISIDGDVSISLIKFEPSTQASYGMPSAVPAVPHMSSAVPYPTGSTPYPAMPGVYGTSAAQPLQQPYPSAQPYPPTQPYPQTYPSAGYPSQPAYPTTAGYPTPGYPTPGYPTTGYPHSPQSQNKGILGGALGGTLGGLAAGAAASSIGSKLLGHHGPGGHHKHSSPIPIAGLVAGAGAAALGAAVLTGHHPFKKAKKMFKHKGFKHKWHKPKFGKWKHKGWSSGSSSEEE